MPVDRIDAEKWTSCPAIIQPGLPGRLLFVLETRAPDFFWSALSPVLTFWPHTSFSVAFIYVTNNGNQTHFTISSHYQTNKPKVSPPIANHTNIRDSFSRIYSLLVMTFSCLMFVIWRIFPSSAPSNAWNVTLHNGTEFISTQSFRHVVDRSLLTNNPNWIEYLSKVCVSRVPVVVCIAHFVQTLIEVILITKFIHNALMLTSF